ncbi:MAG TPA: DUF2076 family protein [Streptosporangiaceae bacterium]
MNQQDQQAIDELFRHLYASASQAGPRDPQAEARIQQLFQQGPPGLLYQMAQTLVAQQHALNQARAQLAQPPDGAPAGFAPGGQGQAGGVGQAGGANAGYAAPAPVYQRSAGGGFLAGAGKIALGVGGGILAADAISSLFDGGGLFGGDRDYNNQTEIINNNYYDQPDGGQQDYAGQQDDGNQQDYGQQADYTDYGNQDDFGGQDFGSGQDFDDGGGW